MKTSIPYLLVASLATFLFLSREEYDMEREEARIEYERELEYEAIATADSLGLTGQDWCDFVNGRVGE